MGTYIEHNAVTTKSNFNFLFSTLLANEELPVRHPMPRTSSGGWTLTYSRDAKRNRQKILMVCDHVLELPSVDLCLLISCNSGLCMWMVWDSYSMCLLEVIHEILDTVDLLLEGNHMICIPRMSIAGFRWDHKRLIISWLAEESGKLISLMWPCHGYLWVGVWWLILW